MIYFIIFISKIVENTLATLRIILVANNKKIIGAILTLIISITWILSISFLALDFDNYLKIILFATGSSIGSYLGNLIEEKIALGHVVISFVVDKNDCDFFKNNLNNYEIIKTYSHYKFEISIKRSNQNRIVKIIKNRNKNIKINIIKVFNC